MKQDHNKAPTVPTPGPAHQQNRLFAGPDGGLQTWGEREEPHAAGPDCRESRTKIGPHIKRETTPAFPAGGLTGGGTGAPDDR